MFSKYFGFCYRFSKRNYAFDRYQSPKIITNFKAIQPRSYIFLVCNELINCFVDYNTSKQFNFCAQILPASGAVFSWIQYALFGKVVESNRSHREKMKQTPVPLPTK